MMKKLFYIGIVLLILFEVLKVYFIMPMPGSQQHETLDIAYFLHNYRWWIRITLAVLIIAGIRQVFQARHKWIPAILLLILLLVGYNFNFKMLAEKMFSQPESLTFRNRSANVLTDSSLVIGVAWEGEAKAYPIRYMSYHHQVRDTIGGKPMMITYCNVCRTGRVFEPLVDGRPETFRLVGMDHFNAMFEDETTGSWWRQATGEAVAGPLKGSTLPEVVSTQMTLRTWFDMNPGGVVMQFDPSFRSVYDSTGRFEKGRGKSSLTGTDSLSWKEKSWVVGISLDGASRAYDWNQLRELRAINDVVGETPVVVAIGSDNMTFVAFERPASADEFRVSGDTLYSANGHFDFSGRDLNSLTSRLVPVKAYQEFWHSWRTFHPNTVKYE